MFHYLETFCSRDGVQLQQNCPVLTSANLSNSPDCEGDWSVYWDCDQHTRVSIMKVKDVTTIRIELTRRKYRNDGSELINSINWNSEIHDFDSISPLPVRSLICNSCYGDSGSCSFTDVTCLSGITSCQTVSTIIHASGNVVFQFSFLSRLYENADPHFERLYWESLSLFTGF